MAGTLAYELDIRLSQFESKLNGALDQFDRNAQRQAKTSGASFGKLFAANLVADIAAAGISRAISAAIDTGKIALTVAKDFQSQLVSVKALAGATEDQYDALKKQAMEFGRTTQFTATESAQAFEVLIRNGLEVEEVLNGATEATLGLAAATGTDLANAADIVTDAMNQFDIGLDKIDSAINGITGVTVNSKFTIDDYRLAIGQAGGVAGSVGVEFEDFNATIAATASNFTSGSDAGTSFKTFLQRLVPQSKEATELMEKYNLEFFNANGQMKNMAEISNLLTDNLAGLSEEQRNNALSTIFGTDAMRTAAGLVDTTSEEFQNLQKSIENTEATGMAETRLEGLGGAMKLLNSVIESLMIEFFDLEVAGKSLIEWLEIAAEKFTEFLQSEQAGPVLAGIAAALTSIGIAAAIALVPVGSLITTLAPIIGIAVAVAAVIGLMAMAWQDNFLGIQDAVMKVWEVLQAFFMPVLSQLQESLMKLWEQIAPVLIPILKFLGTVLIGIIGLALVPIIAVLNTFIHTLVFVAEIISHVVDLARNHFNILKDFVISNFDTIKKIFQDTIDFFKALFTGDLDTAMEKAKDIFKGLGDLDLMGLAQNLMDSLIQGIKDKANELYNTMKNMANDALQGAKDALGIASPSKEGKALADNFVGTMAARIASLKDLIAGESFEVGADVAMSMREGMSAGESGDIIGSYNTTSTTTNYQNFGNAGAMPFANPMVV
jgi:TP901 family phage tail tape measure protein